MAALGAFTPTLCMLVARAPKARGRAGGTGRRLALPLRLARRGRRADQRAAAARGTAAAFRGRDGEPAADCGRICALARALGIARRRQRLPRRRCRPLGFSPARRIGRATAPPPLDKYRLGLVFMAGRPRGGSPRPRLRGRGNRHHDGGGRYQARPAGGGERQPGQTGERLADYEPIRPRPCISPATATMRGGTSPAISPARCCCWRTRRGATRRPMPPL